MNMRTKLLLAATFFALAAPARAPAAELGSGQLSLNGFGSWAAGYTNRNAYQTGSVPGRWDNAEFALDVAAHPDERLAIAAQVFFRNGGEAGEMTGRVDWAFASWRFSDAVTLRVGKVKQPFGIYGEIYDVGTLRPFQSLPAGIYGPADFVGESYFGAGLTGSFFSSGGWGLGYDLYLGELMVNEAELPKFVAHPELFQPGENPRRRHREPASEGERHPRCHHAPRDRRNAADSTAAGGRRAPPTAPTAGAHHRACPRQPTRQSSPR